MQNPVGAGVDEKLDAGEGNDGDWCESEKSHRRMRNQVAPSFPAQIAEYAEAMLFL